MTVDDTLSILRRRRRAFAEDAAKAEQELSQRIRSGSFLVLGGAGTIGQAVVKELFRRRPRRLYVVDLSENNLVEIVRDLRSTLGYIDGDFSTFALDASDEDFAAFFHRTERFDYVLNLAALKHVRSEKDAFTLMRMVRTNVLMVEQTLELAIERGARRYFAVSSDKAANPANAMGATKRVMELCLAASSNRIEVSSARFANVAFSDGSLLHGFGLRLAKQQPLSAPEDVLRYFITSEEAGALCLMACLLAENRECFFPALRADFEPASFRAIAEQFLRSRGYEPYPCSSEEEARGRSSELIASGKWPCYFFRSDTTGEKMLEEFYTEKEEVDLERFAEIGVIRWPPPPSPADLVTFLEEMKALRRGGDWTREDILRSLRQIVPEFEHHDTGRFLDDRM